MAQENPYHPFRCIGEGTSGSVWAAYGNRWAIKLEKDNGNLYRERYIHIKIDRFKHQLPVEIGGSHGLAEDFELFDSMMLGFHRFWITCGSVFLTTQGPSYFLQGYTPRFARIMECIPSLPGPVRDLLIDSYCPTMDRAAVRENPANLHCLIRPYLGSRRRDDPPSGSFSLNNLALHVDELEGLQLDVNAYVEILADTLAHCHWAIGVDLKGVRFVLAPTWLPPLLPANHNSESPSLANHVSESEHVVWMLGYDSCRDMSSNNDGVSQAVIAFWNNEPFYPRPYGGPAADGDPYPRMRQRRLWNHFRQRYLESSNRIWLHVQSSYTNEEQWRTCARLPLLFIEKIEDIAQTGFRLGLPERRELEDPID
ncbi:hypothetical protein K504DRAFT_372939 [Pleomassaria siparia CBS 279.74]|uniref:DUF3669 domain-containing protein n=1 Tax=Pleomassaria siparia CBS 279.74 TaxID=1314801 RepID=A0A6G1KK10_9PLEO|nr:hypothetical protein K504DRAFT_372939 [Pleomassaria siparia CBS 279.74]